MSYKKIKIMLLIFLIINILPIPIFGIYLYTHMGGAKNVKEVVENSPFKEFTYIDHKTLMIIKDKNQNISGMYKEILISINGIYIGTHGSIGIKMPLGFLFKYFPINGFKYYNGVIIKNPNKLDLGKAEINNLINTVPSNYKDILIYKKYYVIGIYYDLNSNKTYLVYVSKKLNNIKIDTEKLENYLKQKTNAVNCKVIDMGNKIYIYQEFNGIKLDLINNGIYYESYYNKTYRES